jgi:hypothetical protein
LSNFADLPIADSNRIDTELLGVFMNQPEFKLSELRAALIDSFSIAPEKESQFNNRIKNLHRIGFFDFGETRRGSATHYGWTEMLKTGIACELFRAGLTPAKAKAFCSLFGPDIMAAIACTVSGEADERPFLLIVLRGLEDLQLDGLGAQIRCIVLESEAKRMLTDDFGNPIAFIDLTEFKSQFYSAIRRTSTLSKIELFEGFKAWASENSQ